MVDESESVRKRKSGEGVDVEVEIGVEVGVAVVDVDHRGGICLLWLLCGRVLCVHDVALASVLHHRNDVIDDVVREMCSPSETPGALAESAGPKHVQ